MGSHTRIALALAALGAGCIVSENCPAPSVDCNGVCVDIRNDPRQCGGCGLTCAAGLACLDGTCSGACPGGFTLCRTAPAHCADLANSLTDCGLCGQACAVGVLCVQGQCGGAANCALGFTRCRDVCADLTRDIANCGACDRPCGIGFTCVNSICVPGASP